MVTRPKPLFLTLVYNKCIGGSGFVSPYNINFPKKCIITSTFVSVWVRYIFFPIFFYHYKPYWPFFTPIRGGGGITRIIFQNYIEGTELFIPRDKTFFLAGCVNKFFILVYNKFPKGLGVFTAFNINFSMKCKNTSTFVWTRVQHIFFSEFFSSIFYLIWPFFTHIWGWFTSITFFCRIDRNSVFHFTLWGNFSRLVFLKNIGWKKLGEK